MMKLLLFGKRLHLAAFFLALSTLSAFAADTLYRWDNRPGTSFVTGGSDTGTVDGISVTASGGVAGTTTGNRQLGIFPTATVDGFTGVLGTTMDATTENGSVINSITLLFSEPVYNLRFTVVDIDGGTAGGFHDQINLSSDNGFPTAVTGANLTYNPATGITNAGGTFCSQGGGNVTDCLLNVTFANPVNTITIQHVSADAAGTDPAFQVVVVDDLLFNTPPDATDNSNTTDEDSTVSGNVITDDDGNGTDNDRQDGASVVVASIGGTPVIAGGTTITLPSGALLTMFPDGSYNYDPNGVHDALTTGQTAIETITYTIEDQEGLSNSDGSATDSIATLTITVTGDPDPAFTVLKSVDIANVSIFPTTLTYTITVNNTGDTTLTGVNPVDTLSQNGINTSITLSGPSGDANSNLELETTETWSFSGTHVVTLDQMNDADDLVNTVSVTTNETGATAQTSQDTSIITPINTMTVTKTASPDTNVPAGTDVIYTYVVRNTGNQSLLNITLADAHGGTGTAPVPTLESLSLDTVPTGDSVDSVSNASWDNLAPGDEVTFTANYTVTQEDVDTLQ